MNIITHYTKYTIGTFGIHQVVIVTDHGSERPTVVSRVHTRIYI